MNVLWIHSESNKESRKIKEDIMKVLPYEFSAFTLYANSCIYLT